MLAVLLANVAIFAPQKAEGQRKMTIFIDDMGSDTNREYKYSQIETPFFIIITCGGQGSGCIPAVQVP